jgi:polyphosphate kinase
MRRNLSKRVELLVPIEDREARSRLIQILETHFEDQARGRWLQPDGAWKVSANSTGRKAIRSQEVFAREAAKRARVSGESPDVLVPHTPQQAR